MDQTTFPAYGGGGDDHTPRENNNYGGASNGQSGGYQKKPWQGGGGNGGSGGGWGGDKKPFKRQPETDMTLYKPYAVTGNRDCPPEINAKLVELVKHLETLGYTLRTGGLEGIEETVEKAAGKKELLLPFQGFAEKESKFTFVTERAKAIAKMFFPSYDTIKKGAQYFLAKNARLVMGQNMNSPALFLLCWTEDGVESVKDRTSRTGFTGHPIAIASAIGVPVFNLGNPNAAQRLYAYLDSLVPPSNPA